MMVAASCLPADLLCARSLRVLMGVYERNYRWLVELLGEPQRLPAHRCVRLPGRPALHVEVRSRSRHTIELVLTHLFADERLPDLAVRLYGDARVAEAVPANAQGCRDPLARLPARWQANLLLYKWLEYCRDARRRPRANGHLRPARETV